jgi:TonB family protein
LNAPAQILKLIIVFLLLFASAVGQANTGTGTQVDKTSSTEKIGEPVNVPGSASAPVPDTKHEGTCMLWLIVDTDGHPHHIKVVRPVGYGLDEKAVDAVKQWKFQPAMKDGRPVAVQINVEVRFRLYDKPGTNPDPQMDIHLIDPSKTTHFTESQLSMLATQWSGKAPYTQEQLAELRSKCSPYIKTNVEDLESNRVPLPPHECSGVLAWMRSLRVESLYVSEKPPQ